MKFFARVAAALMFGLSLFHAYGIFLVSQSIGHPSTIPMFRIYRAVGNGGYVRQSDPTHTIILLILVPVATGLALGLRKMSTAAWYGSLALCGYLLANRWEMMRFTLQASLGQQIIFIYGLSIVLCLLLAAPLFEKRAFGLVIPVYLAIGFHYYFNHPHLRSVERSFSATGIDKVVLRSSQSYSAKTGFSSSGQISISGIPSDRSEAYYAFNGDSRKEHPQDAGMDFVSKQYGKTLIIASKRESDCLEIGFELANIQVNVPLGVKVETESTPSCAQGEPELGPPK